MVNSAGHVSLDLHFPQSLNIYIPILTSDYYRSSELNTVYCEHLADYVNWLAFNCLLHFKKIKKGRNSPSSNKSLLTDHVVFVQHVLERHFASQQVRFEQPLITIVFITHNHEVRGTFINHVLKAKIIAFEPLLPEQTNNSNHFPLRYFICYCFFTHL